MDKDPVAGLEAGADKFERGINDLLGDICGIGGIDKVEDEPVSPPCDEVFRMIFRGSICCVSQFPLVVGYFAGMDYAPARFVPDFGFVIVFIADE